MHELVLAHGECWCMRCDLENASWTMRLSLENASWRIELAHGEL